MPQVTIGKVSFDIIPRSRQGKLSKEMKEKGIKEAPKISYLALALKDATAVGNFVGNLFNLAETKRAGAGEQLVESLFNERFEHAFREAADPVAGKFDEAKYVEALAEATAKINEKKDLDSQAKDVANELNGLIRLELRLKGLTGDEAANALKEGGFPSADAHLARMTVLLSKSEEIESKLEEIGKKLAEAQAKREETKKKKLVDEEAKKATAAATQPAAPSEQPAADVKG